MDPLVVTLRLDDAAQARFEAERRRWFPPGRTQVGAHLTLFHALPGELETAVRAELQRAAVPAFEMGVASVMPLGRGVAYRFDSPPLVTLHQALQRRFDEHLTPQDRQPLRPHVTVQNKVSPAEARATLTVLRRSFRPFVARATGFALWRYEGGPWTHLDDVDFPIDI